METKMKKSDLIAKLNENLVKHDTVYSEAVENYWKTVQEELNERVQEAQETIDNKEEGGINIYIRITEPLSRRESYQDALARLNYDVNDEIVVTEKEFKQYVLNKWDWVAEFTTMNSMYVTDLSEKFN